MKPTSSGRLLNYNSHHPFSQKSSVIKNMLWKCCNFSDLKYKEENLQKIRKILLQNDYPKNLTDRLIKDYLSRLSVLNVHPEAKEQARYFKFPFINGLTQNIQRIVENDSHKLALYNIHTTQPLFTKLKDKVDKNERTNVIYQINCNDCEATYIGQTKQHLKKRVNQHKYDTKVKEGTLHIDKTALSKHRFNFDHTFDFNNVQILDVESCRFKRNISEMIHITLNDNAVNERSDTNNLNKIYIALLNHINKGTSLHNLTTNT